MTFFPHVTEYDSTGASEASNCLTEARMEATRRSNHVQEVGAGTFVLTVSTPYFCKATDAYAGQEVTLRRRFVTRALALAAVDSWNGREELTFTITPPEAPSLPELTTGSELTAF
jgi:hypothetical protein